MRGTRNSQYTEVLECIRTGNIEDVQRCFSTNGKLDKLLLKTKFGPYQETALHLAVKYQCEDIVKWLLQELTAEINATDHFSRTVLHTATNKTEDVHLCAASVSDTTTDGNKDNNIIELILSCEGVDVNARDMYGNTPVKLAAEWGKIGAVRLLLEKAADITLADNADNTTLHVAAKKGHREVLELLLKTLEANNNTGIIGKQNTDKDTPLHLAATSKCPQCVALLLDAGAVSTVEVKNEQGLTVADLAKDQGNEEIIKLLKNPKRAKELLQKKTGRDVSVESDGPAIDLRALPESVKNINVTYNTNISGGYAAVGHCAVVNVQDASHVVPQQYGPHNGSNFEVNMTGGNACVGDRSVINVGPRTPGTPSTAGSRDGPFFPGSQENEDTSSGVPTENPDSFGATELSPRPCQEESSSDKLNESARCPLQEESPAVKVNESARPPMQEESPAGKVNEAARRPMQEESPAGKVNEAARRPMQEESPADKVNESARRPMQEESPAGKVNEAARRPIQEESLADKVNDSARRPMQEESPADKVNESARRPMQEESPAGKVNESARRPMQEESPAGKVNEAARRPMQEESLADKVNDSARRPMQEESPAGKVNEAARRPMQEESPADKVNEAARRPMQEESPAGKVNEESRRPMQEESLADKVKKSPRSPVQEEFPVDKVTESACRPVQEEFPVDKLSESSRRPVQEDSPADKLNESSNLQSLSSPVQEECPVQEKATASLPFSVPEQKPDLRSLISNQPRSSTDERVVESIGPANNIGTLDNSVRDDTAQEAEDSSAASNSKKAFSGATSDKKGHEASKQTWQTNVRSPRNANTMTRAVPKVVQDRLLQEVNFSRSNDMFGLNPPCGAPESPLKLSGNRDVATHRVPLAKSSGTSSLVRTPEDPVSAAGPSIDVFQNIASSNVADTDSSNRPPMAGARCGSSSLVTCAPSPSYSKESPHRKAQHSGEDVTPDSTLPTGAAADVNQSIRTANGETWCPGNHHGDNSVGTLQANLIIGAQSSGDTTAIEIEDENPENDCKSEEQCGCRLM